MPDTEAPSQSPTALRPDVSDGYDRSPVSANGRNIDAYVVATATAFRPTAGAERTP
jgi:hypothetical protein